MQFKWIFRPAFLLAKFFCSIFCKLCKMHRNTSRGVKAFHMCPSLLQAHGRLQPDRTKTMTVIIFQKMVSWMRILSLATKFIAAFSGSWNFMLYNMFLCNAFYGFLLNLLRRLWRFSRFSLANDQLNVLEQMQKLKLPCLVVRLVDLKYEISGILNTSSWSFQLMLVVVINFYWGFNVLKLFFWNCSVLITE